MKHNICPNLIFRHILDFDLAEITYAIELCTCLELRDTGKKRLQIASCLLKLQEIITSDSGILQFSTETLLKYFTFLLAVFHTTI